jgi:UDP-2-acetamido-2,6-beta-L-arabino-hexul-4-ose reductase
MKILVTGSNGFIGKNLCLELKNQGFVVLAFDVDKNEEQLVQFLSVADRVIHLAGINRPLTNEEFYDGNTNFTFRLIELVKASKRVIPIIFSSSTQAELDNDYGKSKRMAEELFFSFMKETGNPVIIYRLTNVFGKWCRPNYNSVVATFCHNIANNLSIQINDENHIVKLVYVTDVVKEFIKSLQEPTVFENGDTKEIYPIETITLGDLAEKIFGYKRIRETLFTPTFANDFDRKLYATFLSYYPSNGFAYDLKMNIDTRGSFTEILKTNNDGQISVNISKPGVTKGNHYHHTKTEKFIVVSGECEIKFRKIGTKDIFAYYVNGENMKAVDIPPGYTHSIKNVGTTDSVTIMWASELLDKDNPDTYFEEVEKDDK